MTAAIEVDGSRGEGGGQILRTSLALSLVTGTPVRIQRVRAGRETPGLLRQHLAALRAAAAIGDAEVEGDAIGSTEVSFRPRSLRGGSHRFVVGSAGSATLVFQTVLPALLSAKEPSTLELEGGTHNPAAPPYDFLEKTFLPALARMGARIEARLDRRGYMPVGGGRFTARVTPGPLGRLDLDARGAVSRRTARVLIANLDDDIAKREERALRGLLPVETWEFLREREADGRGPGNVVILEVACDGHCEVFTAFGQPQVRAEVVARQAVDDMRRWLASDAPVSPHLADQLLLPMALGQGGSFRTLAPTRHTTTNLDVIRLFLPQVAIDVEEAGGATRVRVTVPVP